jgi:hypothetical protein
MAHVAGRGGKTAGLDDPYKYPHIAKHIHLHIPV